MTPAPLALLVALWFTPTAEPMCFASDVKALCCPSACAAKRDVHLWPKANDVLRGCMRGLGCSDSESKNASVQMRCNCDK